MTSLKSRFDDAVFTYYLTDGKHNCNELDLKCEICGYKIYSSPKTNVAFCKNDRCGVAVIGFCVDSFGEISREAVAESILNCNETEFVNLISRLGGKYIIAVFDEHNIKIYPDATASLPVFYSKTEESLHISSLEYLIAEYTGFNTNYLVKEMIKKGDSAKTLPNNLTFYENVYALLPNSCYDSALDKTFRYIKQKKMPVISSEEAVVKTIDNIRNIAVQLFEHYSVKCPLTGGYDSRVVFALLQKLKSDIEIYTMNHSLTKEHSDIKVPLEISKVYDLKHTLLYDKEVDLPNKQFCDEILGNGLYSEYTLKLVCTLSEYLKDDCMINGDIIGQIGKSSLHRNIASCFMGPRYYNCKIHNTSSLSLTETRKWYKTIKKEIDTKYICDNFSEEIRLGRWAANENNMYSLFGINVINIFNCKNVIEIWKTVPRKERKKAKLHIEYVKLIEERLLDFEFDGTSSCINKIARSNDFIFYIATFVKYYIQVLKNI